MKEITRAKVMQWLMDSGFSQFEARQHITKFEKFARFVESFMIRKDSK